MHNLVMAYRCTNNGMVVQRTLKRTFTVVSLFLCFAVFAATGLPSHEVRAYRVQSIDLEYMYSSQPVKLSSLTRGTFPSLESPRSIIRYSAVRW